MNKALLWTCVAVGGFVGGYLPVLLGQDPLGAWSIIGSTVGGLLGIYVAKKIDG